MYLVSSSATQLACWYIISIETDEGGLNVEGMMSLRLPGVRPWLWKVFAASRWCIGDVRAQFLYVDGVVPQGIILSFSIVIT
jgi:hypothetical protein